MRRTRGSVLNLGETPDTSTRATNGRRVHLKDAGRKLFYYYTSLNGRINRAEFWFGYIPILLLYLWGYLKLDDGRNWPLVLALVIGFVPSLALNVKRCHDLNRSGWFYVIGWIPIIQLWYWVSAGFCAGTEGENRFGPEF